MFIKYRKKKYYAPENESDTEETEGMSPDEGSDSAET
jgi:hypothetical protein